MSANLWPGEVLHLQYRMYGLDPGLYVVSDFSFGMAAEVAQSRSSTLKRRG